MIKESQSPVTRRRSLRLWRVSALWAQGCRDSLDNQQPALHLVSLPANPAVNPVVSYTLLVYNEHLVVIGHKASAASPALESFRRRRRPPGFSRRPAAAFFVLESRCGCSAGGFFL